MKLTVCPTAAGLGVMLSMNAVGGSLPAASTWSEACATGDQAPFSSCTRKEIVCAPAERAAVENDASVERLPSTFETQL